VTAICEGWKFRWWCGPDRRFDWKRENIFARYWARKWWDSTGVLDGARQRRPEQVPPQS